MTAIGFLLFALSIFVFAIDDKSKFPGLVGLMALTGAIFMVGGIFRFSWQAMP